MNVAFGLGRLDVPVKLLTSLGADADGRAIESHLESGNVKLVGSSRGAGRTSSAHVDLSRDGSAQYRFDIRWELPSLEGVEIPRWVHTGSIASFMAPGAISLTTFLAALGDDTIISYDPNIRPSLLPDHKVALAQFERIASLATVLKMSDEDAQWLYPDEPTEAVMEYLLDLGVAMSRRDLRGGRCDLVYANPHGSCPCTESSMLSTRSGLETASWLR